MGFSLPSIKCSRVLPAYDYCRTLFVVWTLHNDLITARSAAVESWEGPANIWLTVAKNAFVGWASNFRVRMLLKGAVKFEHIVLYFLSFRFLQLLLFVLFLLGIWIVWRTVVVVVVKKKQEFLSVFSMRLGYRKLTGRHEGWRSWSFR